MDGHGGVGIVIEDDARQVDPEKIRGRNLEEIRPGGLGVHIIHQIMDSVLYEKRDASGMRLTMEKRLAEASACAARANAPEEQGDG